ncbi:zinc dependent phospholipase C family protein [Hazenella coriacea]|uniref:Zinc dependent phospholipase C n=1 Tax=Hazenella coriacea TaxID=1179467 RepID=A0A4R3L5E2_9BACL|nr:zinc dependent phospholipase C family protein [Hazenella coriacea]TCS92356.1 zinc dependent phospholipase C [Hazenella coriacea]
MPYAWTHILFGRQLVKEKILCKPQHQQLFQLGCQGPDFFFFHRFWPWIHDPRGEKLGNLFHTIDCGSTLVDLIITAKEHPTIQDYMRGFVTHHLLDRNTHPYIHYRAGYKQYKHQELEVILDTIIAKNIANLETWRTPLAPEIDVGDQLPDELVEILHHVSKKHFSEGKQFSAADYQQAYQDTKRAFQLFFDPYGIKLILTFGKIRPFRHSKRIPAKDFLNIKRTSWSHPAIKEEKHQESFWDLWDQALQESKELFPLIEQYWKSDQALIEPIKHLIGNLSYDTGKDCALILDNQFSDPLV